MYTIEIRNYYGQHIFSHQTFSRVQYVHFSSFFFCILEQLSFEKNCVAPSNSEVSVEDADHHMRQLIPLLFRMFLIVSASLLPYLLLIYSAKDDCGTFSGKINSFPAPTFVLHIHRPH